MLAVDHTSQFPASSSRLDRLFRPHATPVSPRRRVGLPFTVDGQDVFYVVRRGVLMVQDTLDRFGRPVTELLFDGDMYSPRFTGRGRTTSLVAPAPCDLERLPLAAFDQLLDTSNDARRAILARLERQHARLALHCEIIGQLPSHERYAALLLMFAAAVGRPTDAGTTFEMPLARNDVAGYLALNPDTLSRIVSRWKRSNLVVGHGRSRFTLPDIDAMRAQCSLAATVQALYAPIDRPLAR